MTVERAKQIITNAHPDSIINSILEIPSGYVFGIQPKNWNKNDTLLGGFFKVSKDTGKLTEYSPVMDPEEFKAALKNPLYVRNK